ncbi:MAG: CHAT domain-containing protein [Synechococcales cyanobacterium C42_A2020_086]|nr:CHAT domain-containing protein [Synechococcales cyanobacterium C42_A2020_086]
MNGYEESADPVTQEFHISVTPVGNERFLVRTEKVAPGVPLAEEQLIWRVEEWLMQARQLMNDPLQGLLQGEAYTNYGDAGEAGSRSLQTQPLPSLVELGQELYRSLFQQTLRDSWVIAQGVAQNRREALRLRLGLKGSQLPRLPWEVMYGTDLPTGQVRPQSGWSVTPRPLTAGTRVIFSRYQLGTRLAEESLLPEADQTLRILMVVSAPSDQEQLKLYREVKQLQQELQAQASLVSDGPVGTMPDIQLHILNQPGREQLTQALEQGRYQVLHYAGHSDLGAAGGSLYLVNSRTGLTEILTGDDLAGLLVNNGIRLAVFNSCRGAYTATADPRSRQERNLAEALVTHGIPAVLAMAEQIPDNVALNLTGLFYRNLKLGYPIDLSLSRARQGLISAYGSHQLYWALPILYLHPGFDGYLVQGDHNTHNPADRLVVMPQSASPLPLLRQEMPPPPPPKAITPPPPATLSITPPPIAPVVTPPLTDPLPTEDWELDLDEISAGSEDEGSDYTEDDAAMIADMLRQLAPAPPPVQGNSLEPHGESSTGTSTAVSAITEPSASVPAAPASSATVVQVESRLPASTAAPVVATGTAIPAGQQTIAPAADGSGSRTLPRRNRDWRRLILLPLLGAIGLALGIWGYQTMPPSWLPQTADQTQNGEDADAAFSLDPEQSSGELKALAQEAFQEEQIPQGIAATTALLDRGALAEAAAALTAVPDTLEADAAVNFLRGRLAWQSVKAGDKNYSIADARRFWESAVEAEPSNLLYHQALGFTYYAEGNSEKAIQVWNIVFSSADINSTEALGTYAGIALALRQAAANQPPEQRDKFVLNAFQLYQMVMSRDKERFQPDALRQNWLWTETAVKEWTALGQARPGS